MWTNTLICVYYPRLNTHKINQNKGRNSGRIQEFFWLASNSFEIVLKRRLKWARVGCFPLKINLLILVWLNRNPLMHLLLHILAIFSALAVALSYSSNSCSVFHAWALVDANLILMNNTNCRAATSFASMANANRTRARLVEEERE